MYILTHDSLTDSAKVLANAYHLDVRVTPKPKEAPILRWGNSIGYYPVDTIYNERVTIGICGNKVTFSEFMEKNNIPHVELERGYLPNKYPVVIRTTLHGHGGEGIVIVENEEEYKKQNYLPYWRSPWYNFGFELGVHILGGKIARIFKKVWKDEVEKEPRYPIRNMERGYHFSLRSEEHYPKLQSFIDSFYKVTPLNMGRLDIGWDAENRTYRIIEANTAPSLIANPNTAQLYINYLETIL